MTILYGSLQEERLEYIKIGASIFGIDLDKSEKGSVQLEKDQAFQFKDPSEYNKLTKEERTALTEEMMNVHKSWAGKIRMGD